MTEEDFFAAAFKGDLKSIKQGFESGIAIDIVDDVGWTALCYASNGGYIDLMDFLINKGANINFQESEEGESALMLALQQDDGEKRRAATEKLIEKGVTINLADSMGWTALHHATASDRLEVVEILLKNGADPDYKINDLSESPRDLAKSENMKALFAKY